MQVNNNLSLYVNNVVKITLEKNKEIPYVYGNLIAYLKYDNTLKMYILNHPYEEKASKCNTGEAAFSPEDVKSIRVATDNEKLVWAQEYIKFHNKWVNAKGYDECMVDLKEILPSINLTLK